MNTNSIQAYCHFFPTNEGQIKEFNINATESIKLNTGWVNDLYGEYIQEMMLSEKIHFVRPRI